MVVTIGHSTHSFPAFVGLLREHQVTAVADVRSTPRSQFAPQFNQGSLESELSGSGIKYVFLGDVLGARTEDPGCYVDGQVQYARLARTSAFQSGIERLAKGAVTERIAVMCSEGEPLSCHRTVLISRVLIEQGVPVGHIHGNGWVESHAAAMERLLDKFGLAEPELFRTPEERLDDALSRQEDRIAYVNEELRGNRTADV